MGSTKEVLERDSVQIRYVASAEQAADIFTKAVVPGKSDHALELLNIVDPNSSGAKPYDGAKIQLRTRTDIAVSPELPNSVSSGDTDAAGCGAFGGERRLKMSM